MRKKTAQELYALGWQWGIWDTKEQQWDALSVEVCDAEQWSEDADSTSGRFKVYSLESGDEYV